MSDQGSKFPWRWGSHSWDRSKGELVDPYDEPLSTVERPSLLRPGPNLGREPANKGKRYPIELLTPGEVVALVEQIPPDTRAGIRNRAFVSVLYRAGLRCNEARHLRSKDIRADLGMIRVLFGKGQRTRTVGIDSIALRFVTAWDQHREQYGYPEDAPLFCTSTGRLMAGGYIRSFVKKAGKDAGIPKRVHPHGLRHTHAFELMMEGVPVPAIQTQLGHISVTATAAYLNHIAPVDLLDRIRGRTWLIPSDLVPNQDGKRQDERGYSRSNVISMSTRRPFA